MASKFLIEEKINTLKKYFLIVFWELSGIRCIVEKIKPPTNKQMSSINYKRPSTFFLWLIATYAAMYGVASQRYENRIDVIENRTNAVLTQLSASSKNISFTQMLINRIPEVQNMKCPYKPHISKPISVFRSLFSDNDDLNQETVSLLKEVVEFFKDSLQGVNLWGANLQEAKLWKANLQKIILGNANLESADLSETNLAESNLDYANLSFANLWKANFYKASIRGANLLGADLTSSNNLTFDQLKEVKSLYKSKIDPNLKEKLIKKGFGSLFDSNEDN